MLQKEGREILDLKIFLCFWSESHVPVRYDFSGRYVIFLPVYPEQPGITGIWTGTKHKCFGTVLSSGKENTGRYGTVSTPLILAPPHVFFNYLFCSYFSQNFCQVRYNHYLRDFFTFFCNLFPKLKIVLISKICL